MEQQELIKYLQQNTLSEEQLQGIERIANSNSVCIDKRYKIIAPEWKEAKFNGNWNYEGKSSIRGKSEYYAQAIVFEDSCDNRYNGRTTYMKTCLLDNYYHQYEQNAIYYKGNAYDNNCRQCTVYIPCIIV